MTADLVLPCAINGEFCTSCFRQYCVVVSQRCHRIASFLRLVLTKTSGTFIHRNLRREVLETAKPPVWTSGGWFCYVSDCSELSGSSVCGIYLAKVFFSRKELAYAIDENPSVSQRNEQYLNVFTV